MITLQCYCISGLGADHRLFSRLNLPGPPPQELPWMTNQPGEPIAHYAGRMNALIRHDNPILIGVSFGGMMAIEIAKFYPAATVILISSIRDHHQRPRWMTFCGRLRLERLVSGRNKPLPFRDRVTVLENYFQGFDCPGDVALYRDFRGRIDRPFIRWAIGEILHWKNEWSPSTVYHLQGGRDRIFPLASGAVTHFLPDGGHFMVYNRAEWVSAQLAAILQKLPVSAMI